MIQTHNRDSRFLHNLRTEVQQNATSHLRKLYPSHYLCT